MANGTIDAVVSRVLGSAKKSQDGSISRKNCIKALQQIFKINKQTYQKTD